MEEYSLINGRIISNGTHNCIIKSLLCIKPELLNWRVIVSDRYLPSVGPNEINSIYLSTDKTKNRKRYKIIRFESTENNRKVYRYLRRPAMVLNNIFYITEKMLVYYKVYSDKRWPLIYNIGRFIDNKRGSAPKDTIYKLWKLRANEWYDKFMKFTPHYADVYSQKLYYTKNKSIYLNYSEAQDKKYEVEKRGIERIHNYLRNVNGYRKAGDLSISSSSVREMERPYFEHLKLADESVAFDIWIDFSKAYLSFFVIPLNANILGKLCQIYLHIRDNREGYAEVLSKLNGNRYINLASMFFSVYFNKYGKQIKKYPKRIKTIINHLTKFN